VAAVTATLDRTQPRAPGAWEFDAIRLARTIADGRASQGWSTRELARRADLSQPYVVALERARHGAPGRSPVPTLDVVARLADALGMDPLELTRLALRPAGHHVLMVVDNDRRSPLALASQAAAVAPDQWVLASSADDPRRDTQVGHVGIQLHRDGYGTYDPEAIAATLRSELEERRAELSGQHLGLVFADTSTAMSALSDPQVVVDFERHWHAEVTAAVRDLGAHAAWNVCVYAAAALKALPDPVASTVDLLRSHDVVWAAHHRGVLTGSDAAHRVLNRLRPAGRSQSSWRSMTDDIVAGLGLAA
jgi:transcriptional regulator with XRE-family HTH domain